METAKLTERIFDFQRATFDSSLTAMEVLQKQTEKMFNTSLEQSFLIPKEGRRMIDEWMESYKKGRDDFKKAMDENFQKINWWDDGAKVVDEKMTQVHEDINLIGSKLAALEKRDWSKEVVNTLLKKKNFTVKEDLKPLKKTLDGIEKGMPAASELGKIKKSADQTEAKLNGIVKEIAEIKEELQDLGTRLKSQSAASAQVAERPLPVK